MKKKQESITLSQWLIQKFDTKSYRAGKASGYIHPEADKRLLEAVGGLSNLIAQAKELEQDKAFQGMFRVSWKAVGTDIKKIDVSVNMIETLCLREGIENPRNLQLQHIEQIKNFKKDADTKWLDPFYDHILERLEEGELVKDVNLKRTTDLDDRNLFLCLNAIARNQVPVWKRIFSAAIFGQMECINSVLPSKQFEKNYQSKVLTILKNHSPLYEEGMTDEELLTAHGILSYAQTLEWKGPLKYQLESKEVIDTTCLTYGTILNSQTLEHAVPVELPSVKRIMTIENKANYESMAFSSDTLYIFCHGFFSPKERRFLGHLVNVAEQGVEYFHWGDMDYGGIRIFLFNQKHLFPELRPYQMGREDYEKALALKAGIALEAEKRKKLEQMEAGVLEDLKNCILEKDLEIEQEMLLTARYHTLQDRRRQYGF